MDFHLNCAKNEEHTVVVVRGELDIVTAPLIDDLLQKLIAGGETHLVVDLSGCEFCDSEAMKVLIGTSRQLRECGKIVIDGAHGVVLRAMTLIGMHKLIPVIDLSDNRLEITHDDSVTTLS